jgi:hypothetical protein
VPLGDAYRAFAELNTCGAGDRAAGGQAARGAQRGVVLVVSQHWLDNGVFAVDALECRC